MMGLATYRLRSGLRVPLTPYFHPDRKIGKSREAVSHRAHDDTHHIAHLTDVHLGPIAGFGRAMEPEAGGRVQHGCGVAVGLPA